MITHHHHTHIPIHHTDFIQKKPINLDYIQALEEERRKIQVFERELPLCLHLVTQAIEECKKKLLGGKKGDCNFRGQSECSQQTSSEGPILEEFIPLKRNSSSDDDEQHSPNSENIEKSAAVSKKSDWLRSVQLWNQTPDPPPTKKDSPKTVSVVEVNKNGSGGAFHPFRREKTGGISTDVVTENKPVAAASSTAETDSTSGGKNKKEEKEGCQSQRKTRRSWSPELHKRFLQALQQLGGSNVATPKQIRELMKVDGLTNDEVKSHLQKYRLHNRRPNNSSTQNHHPQQPQFVVVGGIWMPPPPEYTAMVTATSSEEAAGGDTCNGIYAPIATLATPFQDAGAAEHRHPQHTCGGMDSDHNLPASSSSTDTTTTSPEY